MGITLYQKSMNRKIREAIKYYNSLYEKQSVLTRLEFGNRQIEDLHYMIHERTITHYVYKAARTALEKEFIFKGKEPT